MPGSSAIFVTSPTFSAHGERPRVAPSEGPEVDLVPLLVTLRSAVVRYVEDRRATCTSIELILGELRELVHDLSLEPWYDPADTLMAHVARWAIDTFHHEPWSSRAASLD